MMVECLKRKKKHCIEFLVKLLNHRTKINTWIICFAKIYSIAHRQNVTPGHFFKSGSWLHGSRPNFIVDHLEIILNCLLLIKILIYIKEFNNEKLLKFLWKNNLYKPKKYDGHFHLSLTSIVPLLPSWLHPKFLTSHILLILSEQRILESKERWDIDHR